MNPSKALALLVAALNRGTFSDLEALGLNVAIDTLKRAIEPPVTQESKQESP
jgi:hypothetical protein